MDARTVCARLGLDPGVLAGGGQAVVSPIDGSVLARIACASPAQAEDRIARAAAAFAAWRQVPAPRRGELVRRFGALLREHKASLGAAGHSRRADRLS